MLQTDARHSSSCYNEAVRQKQGYVKNKKNADNETGGQVKNGCKYHKPQDWDRSERYREVSTLDWEIAPFLTTAHLPRSDKGILKREEPKLKR